jgi:threonine 3-dehydrogenase
MLETGLNVSPVITHYLQLEQFPQGFQLMRDGFCGKVLMMP